MSGLDKILEHINTEAKDAADELIAGAKAQAAQLLENAKAEAKAREAAIVKQSELDQIAAEKRIKSAADLKEKRMVLEAKQKEIEDVLTAAKDHLTGLDDAAYFETVAKMIKKYAQPQDGVIKFSAKDLGRLPAGFDQKIAETLGGKGSLKIAQESADICGGFILVYGDIEENCSFDALIEASKEDLQDKIGQKLFS